MKMKRNVLYSLSFIMAVMIFLSSCETDPGVGVDNLAGSWVVNENGNFGNTSYTVQIQESPATVNQIVISNFYNLGAGADAIANINGSTVTVPIQNVSTFEIEGTGTLSGSNIISLNFTANDGQAVDNVSARFTKQ